MIRFASVYLKHFRNGLHPKRRIVGRPILRAVAPWRWHRRCAPRWTVPFGGCGSGWCFFLKKMVVFLWKNGVFFIFFKFVFQPPFFSGETLRCETVKGVCICLFFFGGKVWRCFLRGRWRSWYFLKKFVRVFVWCLDGVIQKRTGRPPRNARRALHLDGVRWRWQRSTTRILRWQAKKRNRSISAGFARQIPRWPKKNHDREILLSFCWFQVLSCGRVRDIGYVSSGLCFQDWLIVFLALNWGWVKYAKMLNGCIAMIYVNNWQV